MTNESPSRLRGASPAPLSPTTRMIVSFLLIVHITAVAVAVAAGTGNTAAQRVRVNLHFREYLQALFMDTDYRFSHTQGEESDVGYVLSSEIALKDGTSQKLDLNSIPQGTPLNRQRYYRLCRMLVENASEDQTQALLARSIATGMAGLWRERGVPTDRIAKMTLEVKAHQLLSQHEVAAKADPNRPSQFQSVYAAEVIFNGDAPPIVNRKGAAFEVAPAAADAATPAPTTPN